MKLDTDDVLLELVAIKNEKDIEYVTSKRLAKRFDDDINARHVASALSELEDQGHVSVWAPSPPATYRIEI